MLRIIIIGFFAGVVSELFTTGGGLILVPAFIYLLKGNEREARATSLFCIIPFVIITGIGYYANNYIDWNIGLKCVIGGIIGGIIGAKLLKRIPSLILKIIFILFLIYASIKMIVG